MVNAKTTKGLGRGFDALIPQDFDASLLMDKSERIQKLSISEITPNPEQPRQHFDPVGIEQLAASLKQYGVLQPLIVTPGKEGYIIIAGERRWRAAQQAGLKQLPVIVRTSKKLEQLEIALVENVQRVDLSPLEQANSILRLHEQFNISYQDIADRLGKALSTINNIVRLLGLPEAARQALETERITEGHARAILALKDQSEKQEELLKAILQRGWSVREAERFVVATKSGATSTNEARQKVAESSPMTRSLSKVLDTPVVIKRMARGGRLMITFRSDEDLERIIKKIHSK